MPVLSIIRRANLVKKVRSLYYEKHASINEKVPHTFNTPVSFFKGVRSIGLMKQPIDLQYQIKLVLCLIDRL